MRKNEVLRLLKKIDETSLSLELHTFSSLLSNQDIGFETRASASNHKCNQRYGLAHRICVYLQKKLQIS